MTGPLARRSRPRPGATVYQLLSALDRKGWRPVKDAGMRGMHHTVLWQPVIDEVMVLPERPGTRLKGVLIARLLEDLPDEHREEVESWLR